MNFFRSLLKSSSEIIIKPTIIAENFKRRSNRKTEFLEACENFNNKKIEQLFKVKIEPVEFISFNRNDENISFEKVFWLAGYMLLVMV